MDPDANIAAWPVAREGFRPAFLRPAANRSSVRVVAALDDSLDIG
jgi:hypothetical protein